uniref:Uncharacterized protein n=1 Tax=Lactuca sativa TaxID=4236 RepID=A0A9R1VXI4_LACSA|nr:hypothetical protein LSAT_V11C400171860 [Lactuca sativa]
MTISLWSLIDIFFVVKDEGLLILITSVNVTSIDSLVSVSCDRSTSHPHRKRMLERPVNKERSGFGRGLWVEARVLDQRKKTFCDWKLKQKSNSSSW